MTDRVTGWSGAVATGVGVLAGHGRGLVVVSVLASAGLVLTMVVRALVRLGPGYRRARQEGKAQPDQQRSANDVPHHGSNILSGQPKKSWPMAEDRFTKSVPLRACNVLAQFVSRIFSDAVH